MNIFLLRHGETDWNQAGLLQGHTDIPLNKNGKTQIQGVAEVFSNLYPNLDLIISSPLLRARESAKILADRLKYKKENIIVEPMLIERCFGMGEGLSIAERTAKYPEDNYPEMEPLDDLIERAQAVFDKIVDTFNNIQNILIVSHGAILYAILTAITDGRIIYGGKTTTFEQGSIHLIQYTEGRIKLKKYSEENSAFIDIYF